LTQRVMPNPTPTKKLDGLRSWAGLASEPFGPLNGAVRIVPEGQIFGSPWPMRLKR